MKCITYVSKFIVSTNGAMIPSGLSEIFSTSRLKNRKYNITGVMSYKQGRYIQVLEGDDENIDRLLTNIEKDPRHREMEVLLDFPTSKRYFPDEPMKILPSVKDDLDFIKFINENNHAISFLNEDQLKSLGFFYSPIHKSSQLTTDFAGKNLMLTAWPDFTVVMPSPIIIELCARLIRSPYSYNELLMTREFGDEQLKKTLVTFNALGILKVMNMNDSSLPTPKKGNTDSSSFYMKMKSFLGFGTKSNGL